MKDWIFIAIVAVLIVAVFALFGMWAQIADAIRGAFLKV